MGKRAGRGLEQREHIRLKTLGHLLNLFSGGWRSDFPLNHSFVLLVWERNRLVPKNSKDLPFLFIPDWGRPFSSEPFFGPSLTVALHLLKA